MEPAQLEALVAKHEQTLHGPTGTNGLYSEVRGLRRELRTYIESERKRREVEEERRDEEVIRRAGEEREKKRNRISTLIAFISVLIALTAVALPYIVGPL